MDHGSGKVTGSPGPKGYRYAGDASGRGGDRGELVGRGQGNGGGGCVARPQSEDHDAVHHSVDECGDRGSALAVATGDGDGGGGAVARSSPTGRDGNIRNRSRWPQRGDGGGRIFQVVGEGDGWASVIVVKGARRGHGNHGRAVTRSEVGHDETSHLPAKVVHHVGIGRGCLDAAGRRRSKREYRTGVVYAGVGHHDTVYGPIWV